MILGIIFGLISMLGFGLNTALSKYPISELGGRKTVFFRGIFTSSIFFILMLVMFSSLNFSLNYILIGLFLGLVGFIPLFTLYKGIDVGKIGIVSPIAGSAVFFTVLFAVIFFGETINLLQGIGISLILLGIISISVNFKDLKNSHLFSIKSGIPYALISCVLWGFYFFFYKIPVNVLGPITTAFITEFGVMMGAYFSLVATKEKIRLPNKRIIKYVFLVALFAAVGLFFFGYGMQIAPVSIIATLVAANPLVATIYSAVVYKEKLHLQQYIALLVIVLGVIFMSL